jgi:ankyrin repeat protein
MNMQSFVLPSYNSDIPHTAYSGFINSQVMDVDTEFKHLKKFNLNENEVIVDTSENRQLYFFSQPVTSVTITNDTIKSGNVGLASRGGNNFHILNGIELPNIEFKKILDQTLANRAHDANGEKYNKERGANKLFAIGKLRCQVNEKEMFLENVVIAATDKGSFISCKAPSKNSIPMYYIFNSSEDLDNMNVSSVTEEEFCQLFYPIASACTPTMEQLKINASGRQGANDFFEKLQSLFWNDKLPLAAELFNAIIQKGSDLEVVHIKNKISEKIHTKEKRQQIFISGALLAIKCNNLRALKDLMTGIPINANDSKGVPLLHHAILNERKEIIQFFLKEGADPFQKNKENISGYELACNNIPIFKLLIEGRKTDEWNRSFCLGIPPIIHAMATSNEALLKFLIEKKLHLITKFDGFPLIGLTITSGKIEFLQLLIDNGLSLDVTHNGIHLIFLAVQLGKPEIVQFFVDKCASLNVKDNNGLSPIQLADKQGNTEIKNILLKKTRHNGSVKPDETIKISQLAEAKAKRNGFVSVAKDYKNFLSSINENGIVPKVTPQIENKLLQVINIKHDLSDMVELVESGYVFSKEFYQKLLEIVLRNPNFKNSLSILDQGLVINQQQCNQWILKLIKLGRPDLIKGLGERGYALLNMNTIQNEILEEILCNQKKNKLVSTLIAAASAGLDVRRLPENCRIRIRSAITAILGDQPKILNMFDKLLHLDLLKESIFV